MKQPKKKIKAPVKTYVAESTDVVRVKPILKKGTALDSIKDKETRDYLETYQTSYDKGYDTGIQERKLLTDFHKRNGNPVVRNKKDSYLTSLVGNRPNYNPVTNTLNISKSIYSDDYVSEIAHSQQKEQLGGLGFVGKSVKGYMNNPFITKKGQYQSYRQKGSVEHDAHSIREPRLKTELEEIPMKAIKQTLENRKVLEKAAAKPKIKKANKGIQEVNPEMSKGVSAGIAGATAVAGIAGDALTERAVKNRWGKTNKAQATAGSALSMGAQGAQMGAVAGPMGAAIGAGIGLIGGGIKGAIDADKANTQAEYARLGEKNTKFNDSLTSSTINQKSQFKKGGTSKAKKLIEIEGKVTPEIHTDENFNIKNLGTTPHSKGGDKVVAEEGDVVFPTQNSPAKYNKVMTAIKTGDKKTLKKEQAKLPKDGSKKYATGVDNIETETPEEKAARLKQEAARGKKSLNKERQNPIGNIGQAFVDGWNKTVAEPWERNQQKNYRLAYKLEYGDEQYKKKYGYSFEEDPIVLAAGDTNKPASPSTTTPSTPVASAPTNFVSIGKSLVASNGGAAPLPVNKPVTPAEQSKSGTVAKGKNTSKGGKTTAVKATLTPPKLTGSNADSDISGLREDPFTMQAMEKAAQESRIELGKSLLGKNSLANKVALSSVPSPSEFLEGNTDGKGRVKIGVDNFDKAMELAPIAYNLGKGLFGKVEKVERNYINPEMEGYNDLSASSRSKSNQAYQAQKSNARNASGGNMANYRSNAQGAANEEVSRQADINTQEIGRQTDVNSRNTQLKNNAKQINLELKNQYNELDGANKAAKEGLIQAGLGQLGQLGTRNIQAKNERAAQKLELDSYAQNSNFGFRYNDKGELIGGTDFKTGRELTALEATLQLQKHQQKPAQRTRGGNN